MMTRDEARDIVGKAAGGDGEAKRRIGEVVDLARGGEAGAVHDARLLAEAQRLLVRDSHVANYSSLQRGNGERGGPVNWGQYKGGQ